MKPIFSRPPSLAILSLSIFLLPSAARSDSASWRQQLESEWRLEARVRTESRRAAHVTTRDDAVGGCDGVTNGRYGFHTGEDENPWWQVDLGQSHPIKQVRIWNRSDSEEAAARAAHFRILLSDDAREWREVYRHNGRTFFGYHMPDRGPLTITLTNAGARHVRIQLPGRQFLHLDEVEVISADKSGKNLALHRPAEQSSMSRWSEAHPQPETLKPDWSALTSDALANCGRMLQELERARDLEMLAGEKETLAQLRSLPSAERNESSYIEARALQRRLALRNPLLDFDSILFTKRVPGSFSHMSDQYYGWWSRPGGGICILRNFKSDEPSVESLTDSGFTGPGSFLRPALSYDAKKILFAWCRHYPALAGEKDKLNKANVPEDAFYHVYEMNIDGSGVRRLTQGKYDDFDARYLPDGRIVFLSTRRGQFIQAGRESAARTQARADLPDCYVRCGGDASRPVAVYTLHTMNADGGDMAAISPFEMFEWEPSVSHDGTILYSRWDYIDRDNMPYMSLWAINPDGANARLVYGNYTQVPHCTFEPRAIPGSRKIIFTASGHHSQTMGSLVLLDPAAGMEGAAPVTRLTPDTPFPEIEGWPRAFYANPWPLSERLHLVSWGIEGQVKEGQVRTTNGMGIHLFEAEAGLELLHRDPAISSMYPIPIRATPRPPVLASQLNWEGPGEGRFLVADVYRGLKTVRHGEIKRLRIVALPAKTQPWMNEPPLGLTRDDPGKAVLGTVPVEEDGSAFFRVPSGVAMFFQALDAEGRAVQTMRSATHVQPGQTLSCTGCHDSRQDSPPSSATPLASRRAPSPLSPGPEGSWPLRFDKLVQPVLDAHCVGCHHKDGTDALAAKFDLTPARSYESLAGYGRPSLRDTVLAAYREGVSTEGHNPARQSALLAKLRAPSGHCGAKLSPGDFDRLITWLDTYGQRQGHFSGEQERALEELKQQTLAAANDHEPKR
jgi:hypothetical protein